MRGKGNRSSGPLEDLARHRFRDDPLLSFSLPYAVIHSIPSLFSLLRLNSFLNLRLSSPPALPVLSLLENEVRCSLLSSRSLDCGYIPANSLRLSWDVWSALLWAKVGFFTTIHGSSELNWGSFLCKVYGGSGLHVFLNVSEHSYLPLWWSGVRSCWFFV